MTPIISVFSKQFPANVLEQLYASILISLFILSSANHYYYSSNRNCQKAFAYFSYFSSWSTFLPHKLLLKKYNCQQVFVWSWSSDIYSLTLTEISRINYFQQLHVHNNNNNHFTALCPGSPGWAGTRKNTHPPTILIIIQSLSASSIYHDP